MYRLDGDIQCCREWPRDEEGGNKEHEKKKDVKLVPNVSHQLMVAEYFCWVPFHISAKKFPAYWGQAFCVLYLYLQFCPGEVLND